MIINKNASMAAKIPREFNDNANGYKKLFQYRK